MDLVSLLKWPATVVLCFLIFSLLFARSIRGALDRLKRLKVPGVDLQVAPPSQQEAAAALPTLPDPTSAPEAAQRTGIATNPLTAADEAALLAELQQLEPTAEGQLAQAVRALALSRLWLNYERVYRLIFGTQIMLLKGLNSGQISREEHARAIFLEHEIRTEEYMAVTFEVWLHFLIQEGFVHRGPTPGGALLHLHILPKGEDFLHWMIRAKVPDEKAF